MLNVCPDPLGLKSFDDEVRLLLAFADFLGVVPQVGQQGSHSLECGVLKTGLRRELEDSHRSRADAVSDLPNQLARPKPGACNTSGDGHR